MKLLGLILVTLVAVASAASFEHSFAFHPGSRAAQSLHKIGSAFDRSQSIAAKRKPTVMLQANATDCTAAVDAASLKFANTTQCAPLIQHLNTRRLDTAYICNSTCWSSVVSEVVRLTEMGCTVDPDVDLDVIRSMCSESLCTLDDAHMCSGLWVNQGCPESSSVSDDCSIFTKCFATRAHECNRPTYACPNNCSSHGVCEKLNATMPGKCRCDKGYGRSSLFVPQDCSEFTLDECPDSCNGHGICQAHADGSMSCRCYDGFHGESCDTWERCSRFNFCSGNGNCSLSYPLSRYREEQCLCRDGYEGIDCSERTFSTCTSNCSGHGQCVHSGHSQHCVCDEGYSSSACNVHDGQTCPSQCSGLGQCNTTGECDCLPGFSGEACLSVTNACVGGCRHGYCRFGACECVPGFEGALCNVYNPHSDTGCQNLNFCSGFGVCTRSLLTDTTYSYKCTCFEGFSGAMCSQVDTNNSEECPSNCGGHGKCVLIESPHCVCDAGWTGADCLSSSCPIENGKVCGGQGVCETSGNSTTFGCVCDAGYQHGAANACEVSKCSNDCSGNGQCTGDEQCSCNSGFSGADCSVEAPTHHAVAMAATSQTVEEPKMPSKEDLNVPEDEEAGDDVDPSFCPNECSKKGACLMGKCSCKAGYSGDDCSREMPSLSEEDGLDNLDLLEIKSDSGSPVHSMPSMKRLWD